ncbi:hypothetical protein [Aeromonas salmonicida]|uniref:hypothetical protein n=1 Tax=Aeromonas salmonicida TaxID=645 RepID=UPI001EDF9653|nr:hypothetical protein [Aeromonas salmonicida]
MSNESLNMEGVTLPSISRIAYMPVTLFSIIMGLTGAAIACRKAFPDSVMMHSAGFFLGVMSSVLLTVFVGRCCPNRCSLNGTN